MLVFITKLLVIKLINYENNSVFNGDLHQRVGGIVFNDILQEKGKGQLLLQIL